MVKRKELALAIAPRNSDDQIALGTCLDLSKITICRSVSKCIVVTSLFLRSESRTIGLVRSGPLQVVPPTQEPTPDSFLFTNLQNTYSNLINPKIRYPMLFHAPLSKDRIAGSSLNGIPTRSWFTGAIERETTLRSLCSAYCKTSHDPNLTLDSSI